MKRQFARSIIVRPVPKRIRNGMRIRLGTDGMKFGIGTHFFIYFLSCKRTERPGKVLRASYAILQRHTTGRTLVKNPYKEARKQIRTRSQWLILMTDPTFIQIRTYRFVCKQEFVA